MPSAQRGTGYTNLQQWLSLNQGSANGMGNALAGDAEAKGKAFTDDLGGATATLDQQLRQAGNLGVTNPSGVSSTQAAAIAAKPWSGPDGFDAATASRLYGDATAAQNTANATGSNEGRQALLQKHYGGQQTWGGGALDAALAGAGGGADRMSASRGAYGRLVASLPGIQQNARDMASTAKDKYGQQQAYWAGQAPGLAQQEQQDAYNGRQQQRAQTQYNTQTRHVDNRNTGRWQDRERYP